MSTRIYEAVMAGVRTKDELRLWLSKVSEVVLDFSGGVPICSAQVNGKRFGRFLIDTGAPSSFLSPEAAASLGQSGNTSLRADLCVGYVDFGPVEFAVRSFGPNRLDGLIGTRELRSHVVEIDCRECRLRVGRQRTSSHGSSPITLGNGRPVVPVMVGGHAMYFLLDTGSSASWLFPRGQAALRDVGDVVTTQEPVRSVHTDSTTLFAKFLNDVSVGGLVLPSVKFLLAAPGQFGQDPAEDGILGTDVMSRGVAVFDFPGERFQLMARK
jgi:predicted aspartyl protease